MIIDTFMFRDELDMLECRLRELDGLVDRHVLVESPVTHRGDPKPLYYSENRDRFAAWAHRIVHVVAADLPDNPDPWLREHRQRDAAMSVLDGLAAADDVVLIADVDEFPPWPLPDPEPAVAFAQRLAMYAVDWLYPELHVCTVAARWGHIRGRGLAAVRDSRYSLPVARGGWHLTWLGGVGAQREKLRVTCHTEMTPVQAEIIASGRAYELGLHHSGALSMLPADVDETWPRFIHERQCPAEWFRPR
jgi:Glycosyltransferase family 17